MRTLIRISAGILSIGILALMAMVCYLSCVLPDKFMIAQGEEFSIQSGINLSTHIEEAPGDSQPVLHQTGNTYQVSISLFDKIPVKQVTVQVVEKQMVAACGTPFGIKMFTEGVMVVGLSDLDTSTGAVNPARDAGIQLGDVVLSIDGQEVHSNEQVGEIVAQSKGAPLRVSLRRKDELFTVVLTPGRSTVDGSYKAGMWVRDSSAGIGTMTFYDPLTGVFAGLGHAVCDVDTGEVLPLMSGEAVRVDITGYIKGTNGTPGELQGNFYERGKLGSLYLNNETGIYGTLNQAVSSARLLPVAFRQEVKSGAATILTTLDGNTPQEFQIEIEKVNFGDNNPTKNMIIHVTDPQLIAQTGGIIQGMSGSPIIQDGKLVGAVTHVFVNDPTRGFGIFAENMYQSAGNVMQKSQNLPLAS